MGGKQHTYMVIEAAYSAATLHFSYGLKKGKVETQLKTVAPAKQVGGQLPQPFLSRLCPLDNAMQEPFLGADVTGNRPQQQ